MGWKFYEEGKFKNIRASNEVFIEKNLVEYYLCLLHHGWLSSEGSSEAYNELHRETENVEKIQVIFKKTSIN